MRRTLVLTLVTLIAGLAVHAAPAAASPDWHRAWGKGHASAAVDHHHGPPEKNLLVVGHPNGWEVIRQDPAGQPLTEEHLLAFADAMDELEVAFADRLAAGSETHADLARRATGILFDDPTLVYSPGFVDVTGDLRAAQVWHNVHGAHPTVVGPARKAVLESDPGTTETPPSVGEQVKELFENAGHPTLTEDPSMSPGWRPPATVDELLDLLRDPPLTPVPVPDGSTILPVPVVPIPVPATLAPGPWIPVAPTIPAPSGISVPGGAPAGAPAGVPAGPILRPLREMPANFFVPVTGFDPSGVTGTGHDDASGGGEEECPADSICPGDPDHPGDGPAGEPDDDGGCIGWRECSAVGGGGQPTSIVQTGETGCGIARCAVTGELPSGAAAPPPTSVARPAGP